MKAPPIFYSSRYLFLGKWNPIRQIIHRMHPFDSMRYLRIRNHLLDSGTLVNRDFREPHPVSDQQLLTIHTPEYLSSLKHPANIARIIQLDFLARVPMPILRHHVLSPFRYGTGGTIEGLRGALDCGCAFNIGGGYHHAKAGSGSGFCFFADIPVAIKIVMTERPGLSSILIIDMDAHQGNGYAAIFGSDPAIHIFDMYNKRVFPIDFDSRTHVEFDYPLEAHTQDEAYLQCLADNLPPCISKTKPDAAIFIAGTDVMAGDPLGYIDLSPEAVQRRDIMVYDMLSKAGVPMLMVLGGGNLPEGATATGQSMHAIISKWRKSNHRPSYRHE